ncbi:alanine racemase [Streptomyces subrutilus]|uniref:alanine racemase n=1 Tax=Streptomyces subrutilus TaxID=36818 RepID=UPI0033EA85D0
MSRPLKAIINTSAISHNLEVMRKRQPGRRMVAVLKADGYGHGLGTVARAAHEADAFAVSSVEEALALRAVEEYKPVFLLEGFFEEAELPLLERFDLWPVVHSFEQLEWLAAFGSELTIWLKVDTGMNRLGFRTAEAAHVIEEIKASMPHITLRGIVSHLHSADDPGTPRTRWQYKEFTDLPITDIERSVSNSAGIFAAPTIPDEWLRSGVALYGASPLAGYSAAELGLRAAMTLETELISVRACVRGDTVGYGAMWECPEDMPVGVVAAGYGDGYPRHAPAGTRVLVRDTYVPVIGRICMDMFMVDLRACPDAKAGDRVVLWGEDLPVEEIATSSGSIAHELLCGLTPRVPRLLA